MNKKEVVIKFNPDGSVELEAQGFNGTSCIQGTLPYEKALGLSSKNSTKKMKTNTGGLESVYRTRIRN